jgi:DNA-binding transcriptional LysR family regulator
MIDLRSLRYSILVADYRSFRKAALAVGIRQSSISRRIRLLEDTIGVSIFERHSGGVCLTNAGVEFVSTIRRVLREIDAAVLSAGAAGRGATGRLTVGFYTSLSTGELRGTLLDYADRFPDVTVAVVEGSRSQLIASLASKATDIAIVAGEIDPKLGDAMPLWSERIMVAVPEEHSLAGRARIHWTDLKGERFLLSSRDPGPEIHDFLIARLAAHGDCPTIFRNDVSRENILSMVGTGQGISLLHECGTGAIYPGVVYREVYSNDNPVRVGSIAYWSQTNDNPALRRFLSLLRARYAGTAPLLPAASE